MSLDAVRFAVVIFGLWAAAYVVLIVRLLLRGTRIDPGEAKER